MEEKHTGEHIKEALYNIASEYGIQYALAGITTDNASNMKVPAGGLEFCTKQHAHVSCFAHTLQLAVDDGLKLEEIDIAATKARKLVGHFNRSTVASDALENYQHTHGETRPLKLVQDIATRWNSMYFMFCRLQKLRTAVYHVLHDKAVTRGPEARRLDIDEGTWEVIETIIPVLTPLVDATEALASEAYPSVSCIAPMLLSLITHDLSTTEADPQLIKAFKLKVVAGLQKRFPIPEDPEFHLTIAATASLLDPWHKSLHFLQNEDVKNRMKDHLLNLMAADGSATAAVQSENTSEPAPKRGQSYPT